MTIWDWIDEFAERAMDNDDEQRYRLANIHHLAYEHRQTDPDRMMAMLEEGRRLALTLREPWWVLFFEHWKLETLIYYKDDYRQVIDLAVAQTLELRKPVFEQYPLRFGIYCNLVAAYLCVDARGYAKAIREAMDYMLTMEPEESGDRYLLLARRHWFAYELGEYDESHRLALEELAMADSDSDRHSAQHHEVDTYKALCWIAYRRNDWQGLESYATTGEERARAIHYRYELALFLLWRAVVVRRQGDKELAKRLFRQGKSRMSRLGQAPGESYYDALAAYHELGEDWRAIWEVRQEELDTCLNKGQFAYVCSVHLKRLRLLRRMGLPTDEEVAIVRETAKKLRAPAWYLGEMETILKE
jgi:hypothetical protein